MAYYNGANIEFFGHLASDPREFGNSEKPPVNFRVAVNYRRYSSDENGYVDQPVFYNCTVFGFHAQQVLRMGKGDYVWVSGSHQPRDYQDREGNNRTSQDVRIVDMHTNVQLVRRDDDDRDRDDDRGRGRERNGNGNGRSRDRNDDRGRNRDDRSYDDRDRGRDDDRGRGRGRDDDRDRDRGRDRDNDRGRDNRGRDNDRDRGRGRSRSDDRPPSNQADDMDVDDLPF